MGAHAAAQAATTGGLAKAETEAADAPALATKAAPVVRA